MPIPNWIERKATQPLIEYINSHMERKHKGEKNKATKWVLVEEIFGLDHDEDGKPILNGNTERLLRRCFEISVQEYRGLIVSDENGYWWAESMRDMDVIEQKEARAKSILANCKAARDNISAAYGGQFRML